MAKRKLAQKAPVRLAAVIAFPDPNEERRAAAIRVRDGALAAGLFEQPEDGSVYTRLELGLCQATMMLWSTQRALTKVLAGDDAALVTALKNIELVQQKLEKLNAPLHDARYWGSE